MLRTRWITLLAIAVIGIGACSSSSSSKSSTASRGTPTTAVAGQAATGTPIKVAMLGQTAPVVADSLGGMNAAIQYVNTHGGVNGHPLSLSTCLDNNDANQATTCANDAVNDPSVVATLDDYTNEGAVDDPILQQAGVAAIGDLPFTSADFNSPIVFAPSIGILGGTGAAAAIIDEFHGTKVSLVYADVPAGATFAATIGGAVLKPRGQKLAASVPVPQTAADLSSQIQAATAVKPDGIILLIGSAQAASFVQTARQLGITTPIFLAGGVETGARVQQQLGSSATNTYYYNNFRHVGAGYQAFLAQMAAYKASAVTDDNALNGWLSVKMFADVASKLPAVTRASTLTAMKSLSDYDTGGLTPTLDFTTPGTALSGHAPRIVNPTVTITVYQNGELVPYNGSSFINPFVPPTATTATTAP